MEKKFSISCIVALLTFIFFTYFRSEFCIDRGISVSCLREKKQDQPFDEPSFDLRDCCVVKPFLE